MKATEGLLRGHLWWTCYLMLTIETILLFSNGQVFSMKLRKYPYVTHTTCMYAHSYAHAQETQMMRGTLVTFLASSSMVEAWCHASHSTMALGCCCVHSSCSFGCSSGAYLRCEWKSVHDDFDSAQSSSACPRI
eukprot:1161205-Pelagomonas_calceolata.AAC.4